MAFIFT